MAYPSEAVAGARVMPTVVEGRDYAPFQPADPGEDVGYTRDLRTNEARFPEWVHGAFPIREAEEIGVAVPGASRIPPGPIPDGYLAEKLK